MKKRLDTYGGTKNIPIVIYALPLIVLFLYF